MAQSWICAVGSEGALSVDAWRSVPMLGMLEYIDAGSLRLLRSRYPEIPASANAALLIEQELSADDSPEIAANAADRERFRKFRHALPESVNGTVRRNGFEKLASDYAVPRSRNLDMLAYYRLRTCSRCSIRPSISRR